ncbi:MAG: glycosyltransferase [Nitrospirota bacterium]
MSDTISLDGGTPFTVLLIPLEFTSWSMAKPWSYTANFAIEEGLRACGARCTVLPALCQAPDVPLRSWLNHAQRVIGTQRFDQVWLWLVHCPYPESFLDWVAQLAPVRVGFVMESLEYDAEEYRRYPHLRGRDARVMQGCRYLTHLLTVDEEDARRCNDRGLVRALFWPPSVPARFLTDTIDLPSHPKGAFYGESYGVRETWLSWPSLAPWLVHAPQAESRTTFPQRFDELHRQVADQFRAGRRWDFEAMERYVAALRELREQIFANWLAHLKQWAAIVNLPTLLKSYPGRVVEAMAAGRPVLSWSIPNRPNTRALFEDNREILLVPNTNPDALAAELELVIRDSSFAATLARAALQKIRRYHTSEYRLDQTLRWMRTGAEPEYGLGRETSQLNACGPSCGEDEDPALRQSSTAPQPAFRLGGKHQQKAQATAERIQPGERRTDHMRTDEFYTQLFVNQPAWSGPEPNADEAARWAKIAACLEFVRRDLLATDAHRSLRLIDVGCGRGWLTNLASMYGTCEGIEPVAAVIDHARRLFPEVRFEVGTAETVTARPDFEPYDIVLCSEVIEHVPYADKAAFLQGLAALLKPGGYLVLTTPRGDVWEEWQKVAHPNQPIEDWLTENQLGQLLREQGFHPRGCDRIYVELPALSYVPAPMPRDFATRRLLPIYQVWVCQWAPGETAFPRPFCRSALVSVVVPTYNRPERLREALASLARQTFRDFEVIVVNDGGQDVSAVVAEANRDGRITYIVHDKNRGLAAARNTGLRHARGRYIAYLDDDDRFLPDHLEVLVTALAGGTHKVAYTDAWRVHERKEGDRFVEIGRDVPYSRDFDPALLLVSNYIPVLCIVHERACLEQVGLFDESLFAHEDWDLWIRMATQFAFLHVKKTTAEFTWRNDGSSMTSGRPDAFARTTEIIYRKYSPYSDHLPIVRAAQAQRSGHLRLRQTTREVTCSIIIPVWNKVELTRRCLEALATTPDEPRWEVIIVDNGSTDGTSALLAELGGDVRIIRNDENLGFAKACNQGAKAARGRYLVFLNNDTIPQSGWLEALVREVEEHADVAVVGSKLLYPDGTIQHAGVAFSHVWFTPYHLYQGCPADLPAVNRRREFQAVTAACMLVRREVFDEVGGFDEGYRNGFEDVDLCLKVRERGWKIVYQPKSVLYHLESQTPGRKAHDADNSRLFLTRWGSCWWLADEDLLAFEDGFYCEYPTVNSVQQRPLIDPAQRERWQVVAETQLAGQRRNFEAVRSRLRKPDRWPDNPMVLRWGARVAQVLDEAEAAEQLWRRVLELKEDPEARTALAKAALAAGRLEEAEAQLTRIRAGAQGGGEAWLLQGVLAMQRQAFGEAAAPFDAALAEGADRRKARLGLVMARLGLLETEYSEQQKPHDIGQKPAARKDAQESPVRQWAHHAESAWELAVALLEECPDDAEVIHWLLRAGRVLERWAALAERLARFVQRNPGELAIRYAWAGVLLRCGRVDEARREAETIRLLQPDFQGLRDLEKALEANGQEVEVNSG